MNKQQKANELKAQFGDNAKYVVSEIIDAIKITTGHCTLRNLDYQEVLSDLQYWRDIKSMLIEIKPCN